MSEAMTSRAPKMNKWVGHVWNKKMEATLITMMAKELAKAFRMLSAYLITTEVMRPPNAEMAI